MNEKQPPELWEDLTDPEKRGQFIETLGKHNIPHKEIFEEFIKSHNKARDEAESKNEAIPTTDLKHIQDVVIYLDYLMKGNFKNLLDKECMHEKSKNFKKLAKIVKKFQPSENIKIFLLYTALYHDIGKAVIRPRHGPEGADIIKDSGSENRTKFYKLGLSRADIYLMSDLTRFHDYLAMVGTGETSYLTFVEVLYPTSNISLTLKHPFLDYLLLVNIADVAGSIGGKISYEQFNVLINDFELIKKAHDDISRKVYEDIFKEKPGKADEELHKKTITARGLMDILSELQRLAEDSGAERLRKMLRTALERALDRLKKDEDESVIKEYKKWIAEEYIKEYGSTEMGQQKAKDLEMWFVEDDSAPIIASLRGYNVGQSFYKNFALICKFDYLLSFLMQLLKEMIKAEINKGVSERKSPHDMRRDLAMCVVKLICTLVSLFGHLTSNNTRIGLGFERFTQMEPDSRKRLLTRLTGEKGAFKEAEAYSKLRDSINIWIISPCSW